MPRKQQRWLKELGVIQLEMFIAIIPYVDYR